MTENNSVSADLEKRVIEVLASNPKGVTQKILESALPDLKNPKALVGVLNALLSGDKITLLKKGNQIAYVWKTNDGSKKVRIGDVEEKLVYEAVKRSGNNGVAPKDLKFSCNLPQPQITKVLKALVNRKLIKAVTSKTKRKLYMLIDCTPSTTVTGGAFYEGDEFDSKFAETLMELCYRFLLQAKGIAEKHLDPILQKRASFKSSNEIYDYLKGLKLVTVDLKLLDVQNILESLVYDDKIEKCYKLSNSSYSKNDAEKYYAVKKSMLSNVGLMRMPCGVCLVYEECGKGGTVSPATCEYMKEWLDF